MGIEERYARATISNNLKDDEFHHDHEKLAAVAVSGLGEGNWPYSNMLLRVKYANDQSSYPKLLEEWKDRVKIKAALRGWPMEISAAKVARLSLEYWLTNGCPVCGARGRLPHDGLENVLSDDPCPACAGSTIRAIDARPAMLVKFASPTICIWFPHIRPVMLIKYVQDMVEELQTLTIRAGGEALRKLGGELNDFL